jgi:uncharacterized protein
MHWVLWERLDARGHDCGCFVQTGDGWTIEGTAVFAREGGAACLSYSLLCDSRWSSRRASVRGWIGGNALHLSIERSGRDGWSVNGVVDGALAGLDDIDLGFTPATNTNALRRLNLARGEEATLAAVWLDADDWTVKPLHQSYRRITDSTYDYASPAHDFRATLRVDGFGAVEEYPGLWVMVGSVG